MFKRLCEGPLHPVSLCKPGRLIRPVWASATGRPRRAYLSVFLMYQIPYLFLVLTLSPHRLKSQCAPSCTSFSLPDNPLLPRSPNSDTTRRFSPRTVLTDAWDDTLHNRPCLSTVRTKHGTLGILRSSFELCRTWIWLWSIRRVICASVIDPACACVLSCEDIESPVCFSDSMTSCDDNVDNDGGRGNEIDGAVSELWLFRCRDDVEVAEPCMACVSCWKIGGNEGFVGAEQPAKQQRKTGR